MEQDFLQFQHITKRFPGVTALDDVSMGVRPGEIHALVGENGAGKSTLMNILGGNLQPEEGEIFLEGRAVRIASPIQSFQMGIGFVHQESNLLDNLSAMRTSIWAGSSPAAWAGPTRSGCAGRSWPAASALAISWSRSGGWPS